MLECLNLNFPVNDDLSASDTDTRARGDARLNMLMRLFVTWVPRTFRVVVPLEIEYPVPRTMEEAIYRGVASYLLEDESFDFEKVHADVYRRFVAEYRDEQ